MPTARRLHADEPPVLHAPLDVERVPGLVQRSPATSQDHRSSGDAGKRSLDLVRVVGSVVRGRDARVCESLVRIESLYQLISASLSNSHSNHARMPTNLEYLNRPREEVHNLVALTVVLAIAARRQRVDARAVLAPLVLPEVLGRPAVRKPVRAHVLQQLRLARTFEDRGDAAVRRGVVAELWVGAVAEVGPGGG